MPITLASAPPEQSSPGRDSVTFLAPVQAAENLPPKELWFVHVTLQYLTALSYDKTIHQEGGKARPAAWKQKQP